MAMCPISSSTSKSIRWRPYIQSLLQDRWKNNRITNEIAQSFATQMAHRACHRQRQVQDTPCHLITDARAIRGEDYLIKLIGIRKIERKRSEGNRTCCELLQREVGRGMCHTMHPADTETWKKTHQSSPVWKIRDLGSCSYLHNMQHQLHILQGLPRLSLTSNDICEYFGTSNSTTAQKSRTIKDLLKISQVFDPNFSLKEIATNNPFNRLRMSNGFFFFD